MPRVPKCDICDKPIRRGLGRQVGTMFACDDCLALAETPEEELMSKIEKAMGAAGAEVVTLPPPSSIADRIKRSRCDMPPHVIIEARAGTGKTTTLIEGLKFLKSLSVGIEPSPQQAKVWEYLGMSGSNESVCFVAFNKSIATELDSRVPDGCNAMTMHSMGFKVVKSTFGLTYKDINKFRVQDIICEITGRDIRELRRYKMEMVRAVERLVGLCKMNLVDYNDREALWHLASYYDIELNGKSVEVFQLVPKVLDRCKDVAKDRCVDFNDMIWIPVILDLPIFRYDLLLVDESQDLNRCQQQLALNAGSRLILCGDPKQAIYGFAGADAESMNRMEQTLSDTERGCVHLPLTVTRRCGKAIVEEAKKIVPDFEAHESTPEGKILEYRYKSGHYESYQGYVREGDMILCRVNAPLVSQCFQFLKLGVKAQIQGSDVGQGLINLVKKLKASHIDDLSMKLSDWHFAQRKKEIAKRNPSEDKLIALQDKIDCLECFIEGQETVEGVINKIESVFTDDQDSPGIKLSSIHKAKGLEAKCVFFLKPEGAGCPHPMARSKWAIEQEWNLCYVAITRAIENLAYVS